MHRFKIQQVFDNAWKVYAPSFSPSPVQMKADSSIMACKSGKLGCNVSVCADCEHMDFHNNSCRNRNYPNCQALLKELWIDKRKAEVIDAPYFHVVFTIPAQLYALIYANQALLYSLLHKCSAQTLLEFSADRRFLGATPGIIQVLHTWRQELNFHPHIHCIVSGAGLSADGKLRICGNGFFIPAKVLAAKFSGKLLASLDSLYKNGRLSFSPSCSSLVAPDSWGALKDRLYNASWCPDIRETFNGFGNVIEYLGRYANRIAITNSRVKSVDGDSVTFMAKDAFHAPKALRAFISTDVSLSPREILDRYVEQWPIEVFFRQSKDKLAFDRYQVRSSKGIGRYWLLMSLAHLVACTGCGEAMSFEDGYAYIYSHIQEERLRFIYQCGARHVLFEEVLALVA